MCQLVETIKFDHGQYINLDLHQKRLNQSRKALFGIRKPLNLYEYLDNKGFKGEGLFKCRVVYNEKILDCQFSKYQIRKIATIKLISADDIEYMHKFLDRTSLDNLYKQKSTADEIIIVKKHLITDAYYYNVVFQKDNCFYTPKNPLLKGTQRQYLLNTNQIIPIIIKDTDLRDFDYVHLINAMTPLHEIKLGIDRILV